MSYQQEWYWGSSGPKGICKTGTGSVGDSDISLGRTGEVYYCSVLVKRYWG